MKEPTIINVRYTRIFDENGNTSAILRMSNVEEKTFRFHKSNPMPCPDSCIGMTLKEFAAYARGMWDHADGRFSSQQAASPDKSLDEAEKTAARVLGQAITHDACMLALASRAMEFWGMDSRDPAQLREFLRLMTARAELVYRNEAVNKRLKVGRYEEKEGQA